LCIPYATFERGLDVLVGLVNRDLYPVDEYPYGNWEYQRYYEEHFTEAAGAMEANVPATFKLLFRAGDPEGRGKPSLLSQIRRNGGWFGGNGVAPDMPRDGRIMTESDLHIYASAFERTNFFGTDSLYMNHAANAAYATEALNDAHLDMPVLFLEAEYDYTCDCVTSPLAGPMHELCRDLTIKRIESGHWMAQEKPVDVNARLAEWLGARVPHAWGG